MIQSIFRANPFDYTGRGQTCIRFDYTHAQSRTLYSMSSPQFLDIGPMCLLDIGPRCLLDIVPRCLLNIGPRCLSNSGPRGLLNTTTLVQGALATRVQRAFGPKSLWSKEPLVQRAFGPKSLWSKEPLVLAPKTGRVKDR